MNAPVRGATVERKCKFCRTPIFPRAADVKRGWGQFCGKSCKAKHQERRTGQHAAYLQRREDRQLEDLVNPTFSNAHLFSNEEHDCNKE